MTAPLVDQAARDRIARDLDTTLVVEAAAGTGKTTALVGRILAVLRAGKTELDRIVAVTFTEKAAGEMKLRIREELDHARDGAADPVERARFDRAITQLEVARIGTIHSFCADLLRERPVEAGVDPAFTVAAEDDAAALLARAFDRWFERILQAPPEGVRRLLRRQSARGEGPRGTLLTACRNLVEQRDHDARWRRDRFDRESEIDGLVADLCALAELHLRAARSQDYLAKSLRELAAVVDRIVEREAIAPRDYDAVEAELTRLPRAVNWTFQGSGQRYGEGLARGDVLAQRAAAEARLTGFLVAADADLAACLHDELAEVVVGYGEAKQRAGALDFLDLLIRARDLVAGDAAVRGELQRRFSHVFVDEFQDTDPLQAELVLLLSADDPAATVAAATRPVAGKLFVVGDPKQSLYRFRRADVALYERVKGQIVAGGGEVLFLATSFRSVPAIQTAVNQSFAPLMQGAADGSQAIYVPLEPSRAAVAGQPAVVALPIPAPYGRRGTVTKYAVEASLPDAVAAFVRFLIEESGWTVDGGAGRGRVAIGSRHICLLFRRFVSFGRDVTREYTRALEARQIPHVLVGGRSFHGREEVMAMAAALRAIEYPDDELNVYATLRGPFFAVGDDALLTLHATTRGFHPLRRHEAPAGDEATAEVVRALTVLEELHRARNRRPIADTLADFLARTRAHAGIAIWPTGEQSLANVLRILDEARRFEARGATSFRNFVDWFELQGERREVAEAPIVEEGTEGVRVMTVHKAKGLEFPVVILCDPGCPRTTRFPSRYIDGAARLWAAPIAGCVPAELRDHEPSVLAADDAEEVRIAYVAATRARDLLVVPASGEGRISGWLDVLHPALYPEVVDQRRPRLAPGCPRFGDDTVRVRPSEAPMTADAAVAPGLHRLHATEVVWWDPFTLCLETRPIGGVRHQELLIADPEGGGEESGLAAYREWGRLRADALLGGGEPSSRSDSVTGLVARGALADDPEVTIEATGAAGGGRPVGTRFGTLVHTVLAEIPYRAGLAEVAAMTGLCGRLVGAGEDELAAARVSVRQALDHPLMRRAAAAEARGECRREVPLFFRLDDGSVVDGIADLAFRELVDGVPRWVVVDYKTDPDVAGHPEYRAQVGFYRRAIAAATGEATAGILFSI